MWSFVEVRLGLGQNKRRNNKEREIWLSNASLKMTMTADSIEREEDTVSYGLILQEFSCGCTFYWIHGPRENSGIISTDYAWSAGIFQAFSPPGD